MCLIFYFCLYLVLTEICCWSWSTAVLPLTPSRGQQSACSGLCSTGWICPAPPVWSCCRRVRVKLSVWLMTTAEPSPPSWDTAARTLSSTCRTVRWRAADWTCCFLSWTESSSGEKDNRISHTLTLTSPELYLHIVATTVNSPLGSITFLASPLVLSGGTNTHQPLLLFLNNTPPLEPLFIRPVHSAQPRDTAASWRSWCVYWGKCSWGSLYHHQQHRHTSTHV